MLALVLCGGQSQRMGSDKGLMKLDEKSWAQSAADKLTALGLSVKLSVNEQQLSQYATLFSKDELIVDNHSLSVKGPLKGVLSCHLAFPEEDLFILACDMQEMQTELLLLLLKKYQEQNQEAYIFTNEGEAEPLCGIYTAIALVKVADLYATKKLPTCSMKFVLEQLNVCYIALAEEEKKYFANFNKPEDVK